MSFYPKKVSEKFHAPKNAGQSSAANAFGTGAAFVCGAVLRLTLRIDDETKTIREAKYKTSGCGFTIAAAEVLTEKIVGKSLFDLQGADEPFFQQEIFAELGEFAADRAHCFQIVRQSLQNALIEFRRKQVEEWTGEKALICACFGVSEENIENLVREKSLFTVEEVTEVCRAGGGCGACQPLIQEIIDSCRNEEI